MSELIFLGQSGGTVTLTNEDTASAINVTLPATNGTLLLADTNNNLTVNNLTVEGVATFSGTGQIYLPVGTTSQRTASPTTGILRFNTDGGGFYEGYTGSNWVKFSVTNEGSYNISYMMTAGGGAGGGGWEGGGGGAGGYLAGTQTVIPGTVFTFVIGAGGSGTTYGYGSDGVLSTAFGLTAVGGGGGPGQNGATGLTGRNGGSGSGGEGGNTSPGGGGGYGTAGQGNNGGSGSGPSGAGGGGGGAGGIGGSASGSTGGSGGAGIVNTITGSAVTYASGGAGSAGTNPPNPPVSATANTGDGGPGWFPNSGNGGSGVVILSIPTGSYTGTVTGAPTVTTSGGNTIVTFTSSGSYTG